MTHNGPTAGLDLLTPAEAAVMFSVSIVTIARWRKAGKIPGIRLPGGGYRYLGAPLRALAAGNITPGECTELMLAGTSR